MKGVISEYAVVGTAGDQVSSELGSEVVILNTQSGSYFGLEKVGARIWRLIQEPKTVAELRQAITQEFDVDPGRCEKDLVALLRQLVDAGLVEINDPGLKS